MAWVEDVEVGVANRLNTHLLKLIENDQHRFEMFEMFLKMIDEFARIMFMCRTVAFCCLQCSNFFS